MVDQFEAPPHKEVPMKHVDPQAHGGDCWLEETEPPNPSPELRAMFERARAQTQMQM